MPRKEIRRRGLERGCVANVRGVGVGPLGKRSGERFEEVRAPRDQPQLRPATGVQARERLANAAARAGEEDVQGYFLAAAGFAAAAGAGAAAERPMSLRAIAMSCSTTGITLSGPPACALEVTYLPFTTIVGTPSIL